MLSKIASRARVFVLLLAGLSGRPEFWPSNIASQIVDTETIDIQVYRAGDDGMPIVVMQNMHDYFDPDPKWEDPQQKAAWIEVGAGVWAKPFSQEQAARVAHTADRSRRRCARSSLRS